MERLGVPGAAAVCDQVGRYLALVTGWNARAGLVSERDVARLAEHALDALTLLPQLWETRGPVLDIGSGGGFPAMNVGGTPQSVDIYAFVPGFPQPAP